MSKSLDRGISSMKGDAALPRKNGELVFEEPWEGRAFGLAVAMNEGGVYDWADFRDRLVARPRPTRAEGSTPATISDGSGHWSGWHWTAGSSRPPSSMRGPEHMPPASSQATGTK